MTPSARMRTVVKGFLVTVWLLLPPGTRGHPGRTGGADMASLAGPEDPENHLTGLEWSESPFPGPWVQVERFVVPRYVAVGANVSLECDYVVQEQNTLYSLKWYKGSSQFYQYIPSKTQQPHAVFAVPGLRLSQLVGGREGWRVTVLDVGLSASDVYRCELVAEGPPFHTTQRSANLTVVVLPGGPPTITGVDTPYHLNQWLHLNCTAPPAWPTPSLTWTLNGHQVRESISVGAAEGAVGLERTSTQTGLERATTQLSLQVAQHNFRGGAMTVVCEARLGSLYTRSHQVNIPEPSNRWFSSLNLYHTSGPGKTPALEVTTWILLTPILFTLRQLLP